LGDEILKFLYAEEFLSDRILDHIIDDLLELLLVYDQIISEFKIALIHRIVVGYVPSWGKLQFSFLI